MIAKLTLSTIAAAAVFMAASGVAAAQWSVSDDAYGYADGATAEATGGMGSANGAEGGRSLAGSFQKLPAGDRKTARSLFEGQSLSGGGEAWSLDRIAAARKAGSGGWGQVFRQMKAAGVIEDRSLKALVKRVHKPLHLAAVRSEIVVTNATNSQVIIERRLQSRAPARAGIAR